MGAEIVSGGWRARLGFGVGGLGVALVYTSVGVLLLYFYTRVLGMAASDAGTIMAVGALSDAALDPIVGWVAGRTRTRWGRYRPYLLFGAIPLSLAFIAIFIDPGFEGARLFAYCLITLTIFRAAFQFIYMPYTSLVVVLSRDADERSDIEGWRAWFIAAGQLIVSFGGLSAIDWLGAGDDRHGFLTLALIFAVITASAFLFTGAVTRELAVPGQAQDVQNPLRIVSLLWQNDQFRIVAVASLACQIGYAMLLSGALPMIEQYFGSRELSRWPLAALTASALVASSFWPVFSRRHGKRATWMAGSALAALALVIVYLVEPRSIWTFAVGFLVIGVGAQSILIMQFAAAADALDYGHWKTGERTEAVGFAIMTLCSKVAMGIGNGTVGWAYHFAGYSPTISDNPAVGEAMRAIYLIGPAMFYLLSLLFLRNYALTAHRHREIIADLDVRHQDHAIA